MKLIISFIGIILFFITCRAFPTTINGRFVELGITGSKYIVLLQINTNTGTDDLGGATIVFGFDTSAIKFTSSPIINTDYVFHKFSGGNYSLATVTRPFKNRIWVNIDLPFLNNNNGTVVSASPQWTDVVTIKFDIVDISKPRGLVWFLASPFWGIYDANNISIWETGSFEGNFGLSVQVTNGWNTVSVPGINPEGQNVNIWWSGRDPNSNVYKMLGGYIPVLNTVTSEGYWMKHIGATEYNTGDEWPVSGIQVVPHDDIIVNAGWNLIGGYESVISTSNLTTTPPGLIIGPIYSYSGQFQTTSTLEPGYGYFVKLAGAGIINFGDGLNKSSDVEVDYYDDTWGKILFTDAVGKNFALYLTDDNLDLNLYELPPVPPDDAFDVRFASGRNVENTSSGIQTILLKGVTFPLKLQVENISITLLNDWFEKNIAELNPGEEITIDDESIDKLVILIDNFTNQTTYSLEQNYPNPFNPSTTIKFSIPDNSIVNLSLYNILGELISVLVDDELIPGHYEYQLNAVNLASGVYIYRIIANDFIETKKMILLR